MDESGFLVTGGVNMVHDSRVSFPNGPLRAAILAALISVVHISLPAQNLPAVTFVTDEEKRGGYLVPLVMEAMRREGFAVAVEYMPWSRALKLVMDGGEMGLLGAYFSIERERMMHYSAPIAESELGLFALRDSRIAYEKLSDLRPYTIGVIKGAKYPPEFEKAGLKLVEAYRFDANVKNALEGKIPLFVEKRLVVEDYLKVHFPAERDKLAMLEPPISVERFHVCFSKRNPEGSSLIAAFNRGIASMRVDGTWKSIVSGHAHE